MKSHFFLLSLVSFLISAAFLRAAEVIPPAPSQYVVDEAGVLGGEAFRSLNLQLEAFEKKTSNQVVVAIYPKMQSESSIEDYTVRVAQKWGVGQKKSDNGVVLFVFTQDRKMFIQVGYGLEGALPDLLCSQIIQREIVPYFKQGKMESGILHGVQAIIQATQGEYKGTGKTVAGNKQGKTNIITVIIILVVLILILRYLGGAEALAYTSSGRRYGGWNSGSSGWGGGSGGSSGGWGGGGGGFSGGGGSFGGGGSGGSW